MGYRFLYSLCTCEPVIEKHYANIHAFMMRRSSLILVILWLRRCNQFNSSSVSLTRKASSYLMFFEKRSVLKVCYFFWVTSLKIRSNTWAINKLKSLWFSFYIAAELNKWVWLTSTRVIEFLWTKIVCGHFVSTWLHFSKIIYFLSLFKFYS